jgi:DNA-binding NtrC family response regulator
MDHVAVQEPVTVTRAAIAVSIKGKILLLDSSTTRRDLRARSMKTLGIKVDCAAGLADARLLWQPGVYELVLIDLHNTSSGTQGFCKTVQAASPHQRVLFYVGSPAYLSASPGVGSGAKEKGYGPWNDQVDISAAAEPTPASRGSICEAAWRISAGKSTGRPRTSKPPTTEELRINAEELRAVSFSDAVKQAERALEVHPGAESVS